MKVKFIIDLDKLEPVSANAEQKLVGGFSSSLAANFAEDSGGAANNCLGGNCTPGCGIIVGPAPNYGCNRSCA
jgi:hypothetical protein